MILKFLVLGYFRLNINDNVGMDSIIFRPNNLSAVN